MEQQWSGRRKAFRYSRACGGHGFGVWLPGGTGLSSQCRVPEEKALQESGDRKDLEGHAGHLKIGEMGELETICSNH